MAARLLTILAMLAASLLASALPRSAEAARIKDIAHVHGARDNQLIGYGIVVGLDGTGDTGRAALTTQTISSMLGRMNIKIDQRELTTRNAAAVMVTAKLPAFARSGQKLDVAVSSLADARSLFGGTLIMTPLRGVDGEAYAVAQGQLSVGGYSVQGAGQNRQVKNHLNVGRIPNGALIERSIQQGWAKRAEISLHLFEPDFTTAVEVARRIGEAFPEPGAAAAGSGPMQGIARAEDATTVRVRVPEAWRESVPEFVARLEGIDVVRDVAARVIINERTGTVVLGGSVRIREVAVTHGNLHLSVSTRYLPSQPAPFRGQGDTVIVPDSSTAVSEPKASLQVLAEGASIGEVVSALNALGVTPRDLIAILQSIEAAGALDAQLEVR